MSLLDLFVALAGLAAVLSSATVAFHPNILHAAIALTFTLLSVAGLYAALGADFVAGVQLIIYVGGVIVVILFAIMMSEQIYRSRFLDNARKYLIPILFGACLFGVLMELIGNTAVPLLSQPQRVPITSSVGRSLVGLYSLPLEYVALLLLLGLVGAVVMARPNYREHSRRGR